MKLNEAKTLIETSIEFGPNGTYAYTDNNGEIVKKEPTGENTRKIINAVRRYLTKTGQIGKIADVYDPKEMDVQIMSNGDVIVHPDDGSKDIRIDRRTLEANVYKEAPQEKETLLGKLKKIVKG